MHAVRASDVDFETVSGHRSGRIEFRRLLQGRGGSPGNFEASLIRTGSDYATPRHRHTFDQVRLALEGTFNWAKGEDLEPGSVLYVPEGTWYGPQRGGEHALVYLIQYGGAGGAGFLSYDQLDAGYKELAAAGGTFANGIFRGTGQDGPDGKRRNQDGYEAIYEHVTGTATTYPPARYEAPVVIHPASFRWVADQEQPGVAHKPLGTFGERGHGFAMLQVTQGATHLLAGTEAVQLLFITTGTLRHREQMYGAHTACLLPPGDPPVTLEAVEDTELFVATLHRHPTGG